MDGQRRGGPISEQRHRAPSPEKGPPYGDWEMLDDMDRPKTQAEKELAALRIQADTYKNNFFEERKLREKVEADSKALEEEIERLKQQLPQKEAELEAIQCQIRREEDDKRAILRKKREDSLEAKRLRQEVEALQEKLREAERERRESGRFMHPNMAQAAAPARPPWSCLMCTFENAPHATACEICKEPAPARRHPTPPWANEIVCDYGNDYGNDYAGLIVCD